MTDEQIIKALECCQQSKYMCPNECPYYFIDEDCGIILPKDTLDLINRQKAEIKKLTSLCTSKDVIINSQEAEIEGLKQINPIVFGEEHKFCNLLGNTLVFSKTLKDYNDMRKGLKSEAIKEFAERFEDEMGEDFFNHYPFVLTALDNIVTDMTEGGVQG